MERLLDTLPAILRSLEPNALATEAMVLGAWAQVAGDGIAARSRATSFAEKRLVVSVPDDIWRRHLEELSPQMVARLNERLGQGTVTFIEFRVDARTEYGR